MKKILNGLIYENPIFILALGLCSALAVTTKLENAYIMGLSVLVVLIFSNFIISLIKKLIPDNVKIPVYITIVGTFVTILEIILREYVPNMYDALGIYLPLIIVNCIVFGRALTVASKESIKNSFLDAIGMGLGYTFSLVLIALIREILGSNTITIVDNLSSLTGYKLIYTIFPKNDIIPFSLLETPAGAFLVIGLITAMINYFLSKRRKKNELN